MRVEEKTVHAPRVGLVAAIHIFVVWNCREVAIVFGPQVVQVVLVFHFRIVDPRAADSNTRNTDIVADFSPEVSSFGSVVLQGFLLRRIRSTNCSG